MSYVKRTVKTNIDKLQNYGESFEAIYKVIFEAFDSEIFGEELLEGLIVETTYSQLSARVERYAALLASRFEGKTGIIGVYMQNSIDWVACFWAILKSGSKPLLLDKRQDVSLTDSVIEQLSPLCVLSDDPSVARALSVEELKNTPLLSFDAVWGNEMILVTSGSTGVPKLVCHSGRVICSQVLMTGDIIKANPEIIYNRKAEVKILAFLPFNHIFGLVSTLMWFSFFGRTLVFLSDYNPKRIQHACLRHGVTNFFAVPFVWDAIINNLLKEVEKRGELRRFNRLVDFSVAFQNAFPRVAAPIIRLIFKKVRSQLLGTRLKFCISGGGFTPERTMRVMNAIGYSVYIGYGLTECGITSVEFSRRPSVRTNSNNGRMFRNVEYRLNDSGEIEIAKENCFIGVYRDGSYIENTDEFYNTRDRAYFTKKGKLILLGRADDIIVTAGGENISPAGVESKVRKGSYKDCALLYAAIEGQRELVLALTAAPDSRYADVMSAKPLFESIAALPLVERPRRVILVLGDAPIKLKSLDRKGLTELLEKGKLAYADLKPLDDSELSRARSEAYGETLARVKAAFALVTKRPADEIGDNADFINDLGGDSLSYYSLCAAVSDEFSIELSLAGAPLLTPHSFTEHILIAKQ